MSEPNSYSARWFDFFQFGISDERTLEETEFVCGSAPLPDFRRVLDVCCGTGRHARSLASRGYAVTGVDRDAVAIAKARQLNGGPDYIQKDIRAYDPARNAFDLVIIMSQSFGYFEAASNRELLDRLANGIRKGGRVLLDLWNPEFFVAHQGERILETSFGAVLEKKSVQDGRLIVHLTYPDGTTENFEWELFTPSQMRLAAETAGLILIASCTSFSADTAPNPANPRIQFVLEKA